jgi:hypothetical protein
VIPNRNAVASFSHENTLSWRNRIAVEHQNVLFPRVAEAATLGCGSQPRWGSQNAKPFVFPRSLGLRPLTIVRGRRLQDEARYV